MRDSYLTYAMSTIMDRALPDVRDVQIDLRARLVQDSTPAAFPGRKISANDAGSGESNV